MTRINWKSLVERIPISIRTSDKDLYHIVFAKDFKGDYITYGETNPNKKQIVMLLGLTPKLTVSVYIHELIHAINFTYDVGLTETQVLKLEKALMFLLKSGNVFELEKKK